MFKSITAKLTLLFTCLAVLVALISGLSFTALYGNHLREEEKKEMESCATQVAQLIKNENMLATLDRKLPTIGYISQATGYDIWVCHSTGTFFITGSATSPSRTADLSGSADSFVKEVLQGYSRIGNDFSGYLKSDSLSVGVPILSGANSGGKIAGAVIMHATESSYGAFVHSSWLYIFAMIVVSLIFSFSVGFIFSSQFVKPLNEISTAAAEMSHGNYDVRVGHLNQPELNMIGDSINSLARTTKDSVSDISNETAKLSNIIENISDGLAVYDTNLNLVKYNAALLNICDEDYFLRDDVRNAMLEVMEDGRAQNVTIEVKDKILSFTITQIKSLEKVDGVIAVVSDITERERLEQTRREFVSNVSHEFRTPLTIIRGAVELLMDDVLDSEEAKKQCYQKIDTESAALTNLVKDLLDTSRMKSGKIKIEPREVDLDALAKTITDNMQMIAANKKIKINYEPVSIPPVWGDEARLRQLMIIFIDNAIKFTPEKGTITVSIYAKNKKAYLCVKDTGCGIPKEDQPYIFERFYKVDKARGGSETGTGLGLAIAWQIAKLHKGTILIESEPGHGTTFKTVLPLADKEEDEE